MKINFLVSVYIPTFNRANLLVRAVKSVLRQTYQNIEIIVVNDGDELPTEVTNFLLKNNVKIFQTEGRQGACVARNKAIIESTGAYITGLDDDDQFTPNRIQDFMESTNTYGDANYFTHYIYEDTNKKKQRKCNSSIINTEKIYEANYVHNQMFAPKVFFIDSGLFDEELPAWQDYDMWIRMIEKFGPAKLVDNYSYIMDGSQDVRISKSPKSIEIAYNTFLKKYKKYEEKKYAAYLIFAKQNYLTTPLKISDFWLMLHHVNKYKIFKVFITKIIYRFKTKH